MAEARDARRERGKKNEPRGDVEVSFIEAREARRELDPPPSTCKINLRIEFKLNRFLFLFIDCFYVIVKK